VRDQVASSLFPTEARGTASGQTRAFEWALGPSEQPLRCAVGVAKMADDWSKKQRREVRELQGLAWERELEEALR